MPDDTDCGTFGRYAEIPLAQMPPEMRAAYDFTHAIRGLVPT
jgi:4-carboxymuconolactone decarboxylase